MASKFAQWINTHRTEALLGGAGAVAGFALYRSKKAASGTSTSGLFGTSASAAVPTVSGAYGPYDSSQLDQYNQLAGAISSLNDQVNSLQTASASGAVSQLPTNGGYGALVGAGYGGTGAPVVTSSGTFSQIGGGAGYESALQSGQSVYYEPAPGVFEPISGTMEGQILTSGTPFTNTPTYLKAS